MDSTSLKTLITCSEELKLFCKELQVATQLSVTGITNLIVHHENPVFVDEILKASFNRNKQLYKRTINIDAVELERGYPDTGNSISMLEQLIYGTVQKDSNGIIQFDQQTGERLRDPNGFVNRLPVINSEAKDLVMIIRNIDYSRDFCPFKPALVEKGIAMFDNFRHPKTKRECRILLVTNKPLVLPFNVRTIEIPYVNFSISNNTIYSTSTCRSISISSTCAFSYCIISPPWI